MAGQGRGERCEIDPLHPMLHCVFTTPAKAGAELIDRCFRAVGNAANTEPLGSEDQRIQEVKTRFLEEACFFVG
jgi:hypothetical protein